MTSKVIETGISTANVRNAIEWFLQSSSVIRHTEDIISIELGKVTDLNKDSVIPLKIKFREQGVEYINVNGKSG